MAGAQVRISAPRTVYLNNTARAVFSKWIGSGFGAYTGSDNKSTVYMYSNVSEYALYTIQYFVNITSKLPTFGTGWYNEGSIVKFGVSKPEVTYSNGTRFVFENWTNGCAKENCTLVVNGPASVHANSYTEYFVNATSQYGNVTGSNWYAKGSVASLSLSKPIIQISPTERLVFLSWSNGSTSPNLSFTVSSPVFLHAVFGKQYLVRIMAYSENNESIQPNAYMCNGVEVNSSAFLSVGAYKITGALYKGVWLNESYSFYVNGSEQINLKLPVLNVLLVTRDLFGMPVNASVTLEFANKSSYTLYTGSDGSVLLRNVPYGYVKGVVNYLFEQPFESTGKSEVLVALISPGVLLVVCVIPLIAIAVAILFEPFRKGMRRKPRSY